jgi:hypothetical protein
MGIKTVAAHSTIDRNAPPCKIKTSPNHQPSLEENADFAEKQNETII